MRIIAVFTALVLTGMGAFAQTVRTVYIDPAASNAPASWNNFVFTSSNNAAVLKDTMANVTGIRATVTRNMNPGGNTNGSTTPGGDAAEFQPAGGNSAYGHSTDWGGSGPLPYSEVVFSNLNANLAYTFTFYASRMNVSDNREAQYTVSGSTSASVLLNSSNNSNQIAAISNIYPLANGTLTLGMQKGPNNNESHGFYYLSAMKIVYAEPQTVAYIDAAGGATASGWNLLSFLAIGDITLIATNGVSTGIRTQITAPLGNVNNTISTPSPTGAAAEFQPAGTEGAYGGTATMKLYALNPTVGYNFTFFASRTGSSGTDRRQTMYTVIGATTASNNLEAANNTANVALITNIFPAADGTITVNLSAGLTNNTFTYLTALKVAFFTNGNVFTAAPITGKRLLFFGNQYSSTENVPTLVAGFAQLGGYTRPYILSDFANDRTLASQITRVNTYPGFNVDYPLFSGTNTWDHVVIQGHGDESSALGNVTAFRTNALALLQKVRGHASGKGANAGAVLFQTWARGAGSTNYPANFASAAAMQAEIRANYETASNNIVAAVGAGSVRMAGVGDAFERGAFASSLYAADLNSPGNNGPELAALVLYKALYGAAATALPYLSAIGAGLTTMSERDWIRVTNWADGLTPPEPQKPASGDPEVILLDAGANTDPAVLLGWNYLSFHTTNSVQLVLTNGYPTPATCTVVTRMDAASGNSTANLTGSAALFIPSGPNNTYGHINPFQNSYSNAFCEARFSGLSPVQSYTFTLFGARTGVAGGISRETLYTLTGANSGSATLETANNTSQVVTLESIRPTADGAITLRIEPGSGNNTPELFYHINALKIESARSGMLIMVR